MHCYYLSISAHQWALEANVLFKRKTPIRNKYQFCQRNRSWNSGPYVWGEQREKTEQRRWRRSGGGVRRGVEAGASVYSQTGCFGILSLGWQEYWIWQTSLCIHKDTKKQPHARIHKRIGTALQTATCPPCTDPAGISLCGHGSFWTTG